MGWRNNLHGRKVQYNDTHLFLNGRPVNNDEVGLGQTFYVDSGVDGTDGTSPDNALGTLDEAVNKCTAGNGDKIVVMAGHAETISGAAGVDIDVNDIEIVGLGRGSSMPEFTFSAAASTIEVNADNILVQGLKFSASVDSVAVGIDVLTGSANVHFDNCVWEVDLAATDEFDLAIRFAAACDECSVTNCVFDMDLADAVAAIEIIDVDRPVITGNKIMGDYSTACVLGLTTLSTNVDIGGNLLLNGEGGNLGAQPNIELITGSTGIIYDNYCVCNLATKVAAIVADTCLLFENYYNEDIQQTGGLIGTASADD